MKTSSIKVHRNLVINNDINSLEHYDNNNNIHKRLLSPFCTYVVQSYAQKMANLKQIAIVMMTVVLVSTIYIHYRTKVHRNPRSGTLSFLTSMTRSRNTRAVSC